MLKRFFISFLGSLAGVMVAGFLGFFVLMAIIVAAAASEEGEQVALKDGSVMRITLSGAVADREEPTPIADVMMGNMTETIALNDLVKAIERAGGDDKIEGICLDCRGVSAGLTQLQAIRSALAEFKESGKWVYAYADTYTQTDYFVATVADSVFINPEGAVDIHGLSSTVVYFKDLLTKLGVNMQVVKVGTYKSAVEPFLLNDMSAANREQMDLLLGNMWNDMVDSIADDRGVDSLAVNAWANGYNFAQTVATCVENKVVDKAVYRHEFDERLAQLTGNDQDKDEDNDRMPNYIDFKDYLKSSVDLNKVKGSARIAVLYATGDITENGEGGIASERLVPEILKLADNKDIDGLIMRVNSGGGSAFASEQIWEALEQFKARTDKPFYVSMGDYAASGGYYISCGADRIYAEPLTLTGSIGIFGMIPEAQELLTKKIGVNFATVETNTGQMPTLFKAMTPQQQVAMQSVVDRGYDLFTRRCADGRQMSQDSIKVIGEGRVWDGVTALRIGLVDKLGGLDQAINDMAAAINEGKEGADGYQITEFPKVKLKWYDEVMKLNTEMRARAVKEELGDMAKYYYLYKNINDMHAVQARIDYIEIR